MNGPPENDLCSICHSHFTAPCQANCSHWFCGNCIMLVWRHGSTLQPCKCPLCRRPISLLVPTEDTIRNRSDSAVSEVLANLETYNRYFGGRSTSLIQRMQDLPFLLRRLLREMMDPQRTLPLVIRARVYIAMILSVVYIVSPIDIIPEGVLGVVGLLDDLLIALICFLHVAALYRSVLYFRHAGS
ncbi:E3 ubiquitin-protein ligase RNF170 [Brassica napus]|nr:E3 ubiquitin-protein ligase RNF170 [Brassica napus]